MLVWLCWLLGHFDQFAIGWLVGWVGLSQSSQYTPKEVANFMHVSGHVVCKRWWCSEKALGVTNLDAI